MTADLTLEVLREIRDGIRATNARLDGVRLDFNTRLDETNGRLERVERRLGRVEQGLTDLGGFMRRIALDLTGYERFHAQHVERLEDDVSELEGRVRALEDKVGP